MSKPFVSPVAPAVPLMTDVERKAALHAERNTAGHAAGMWACPVCGDSMNTRKDFHETVYHEGTIQTGTLANADGSNPRPVTHEGSLAVVVLCEDCWSGLTPAQRLPHYEARMERWKAGIRPAARQPAEGVGMEDHPADAERYARDVAAHEALAKTITDAVLAGG